MSMIAPAIMYMVFAVCFLLFSYMMGLQDTAEIFQASAEGLVVTPWSLDPRKTVYDVKGGAEVYEWLTKVFLNLLYEENPKPGDTQGYCTEVYKCLLDEGDADRDSQCAGSLRVGVRNCPSFLGFAADCCEPCSGHDCPSFEAPVAGSGIATEAISNLSASCSQEMPSWHQDLSQWNRQNLNLGLLGSSSSGSPSGQGHDVEFCPERMSKVNTNLDTRTAASGRQLKIGHHNRALMARMSMKRRKLVPLDSTAFNRAYPTTVNEERTFADSYSPDRENEASFGKDFMYHYQKNKGYQNAGGFVTHIDFDKSKDEVLSMLSKLKRNYWFDLNQGSLALEMLLFNGNVERFVYVSFLFEHDFSGQTDVVVNVNWLDLSLHDLSKSTTYIRFAFYLVLVILFCIFVKTEIDDMTADYATYFSNFMMLVHLTSLVLCAICIVQYLMVVLSYTFRNFQFPLSQVAAQRAQDFEDLGNLANNMGTFMRITSMNACLILFRCITLMTTLIPQSGVIFNTFGQIKFYLVSFFVMFAVMLLGFTMAGYYLFGTRLQTWSTLTKAFLSAIRMILRDQNRNLLLEGDRYGFYYFMVFHLFFLIVAQILLSVLMFGYDKERERINKMQVSDKYPLKKVWRSMASWLRRKGSPLFRAQQFVQQLVFGAQGGGAIRANFEQVAKLRDLRATKPQIRNVLYEQRPDDDDDIYNIDKDITLRAVMPFYPKGMVHYYVESVQADGPAQEFGVKNLRLVAIQRPGSTNKRDFRSLEEFEKFGKDPQKLLEDINKHKPVTLEFEGGVNPVSRECLLLSFFIAVFLAFSLQVSRTMDSYSLAAIQYDALIKPQWYEYNPTRVVSLGEIHTARDLEHWVQSTILDREYGCVTGTAADSGQCAVSQLTETLRPEWQVWAGPGVYLRNSQREAMYNQKPAAAAGFSIAYVPVREGGTVNQAVRMNEQNVGIMRNNHVRLTLQVACFRENENQRWAPGYPLVLHRVFDQVESCASEPCMEQMINENTVCKNSQGEVREANKVPGSWSGTTYEFSTDGTYNNLGGIAVGLGNTKAEATLVINTLVQDQMFRTDATSFVFEFVTYNGNFDMFTYTKAMFNLRKTGKFSHSITTSTFPLNLFSMGSGQYTGPFVAFNWVCFVLYIIVVIVFTIYLFWALFIQYCITLALNKNWYMFLPDFFILEDWWNIIDLVSVILNWLVIEHIFNFILFEGRVSVSSDWMSSWTLDYRFEPTATQNTVDPMRKFEDVAFTYQTFTGLAAVNGLFLLLRFAKYFNGFLGLRLILTAISSAVNELIVMTLIFLVMLFSFVFMFFTLYGVRYPQFDTIWDSFIQLFLYLMGRFDSRELMQRAPVEFVAVFMIFQIMFTLILSMFLAAIVYRWKDTRRDAQEVSLLGAWQKLKEPCSISVLSSWEKGKEQEQTTVRLDTEFWQKLSVLHHLAHLDESGRVTINTKKESSKRRREAADDGNGRRRADSAEEGSDSEHEFEEENHGGFKFENEEDKKRFIKVFKKAHMEIASQMCRSVNVPRADRGAGVGLETEEDAQSEEVDIDAQMRNEDSEQQDLVGIIEEPQPEQTVEAITKRLNLKLEESEHPAEEIWLDALVTVLEEAGGLKKLQDFFRPLPMIKPTKPQEIGNFNQKKFKMETRLNLFLRWLQEEARVKHYGFLKIMAEQKEKNLKQQSLVLTDYLETLDAQIVKLDEEIKVLERKNAQMRSHVSPLL